MKSLVMVIIALVCSIGTSLAQDAELTDRTFIINYDRLKNYLDLDPIQMNEVYKINEDFTWMQQENLSRNPVRQLKQKERIIFSNLKQMKKTLTNDQYRKYIALINVTNNNYKALEFNLLSDDIYMADTSK